MVDLKKRCKEGVNDKSLVPHNHDNTASEVNFHLS